MMRKIIDDTEQLKYKEEHDRYAKVYKKNLYLIEISELNHKWEINIVAIKRHFILAISICVVALIIEAPPVMWISFVFIALWGHSLFKGLRIQKAIAELEKEEGLR